MKAIKKMVGLCLSKTIELWMKLRILLLKTIFFFFPVKGNKVLFMNFNGRGFGCNPKYIALEILNQDLKYDLVWLVSDLKESFPMGIRKVQCDAVRAFYELATARVIVTNVKNDLRLVKKKNQYVIQTWHGSYSAKRLEREAADTLSQRYLKESRKNSKQTDLFLSNSRVLSECYRSAFWCECEIMECGFPRNDMLFPQNADEEIKRIKGLLNLPQGSRIILYAPTFRDDGSKDAYNIDCEGILGTLRKKGEDWYLLIRMHPNVGDIKDQFVFDRYVINATPYPDMQDLLLAGDILITDYSSTVFEFAAMKKPTFIYAPDVEEYQKMRGLKEDFFRMPYPVCRTNAELLTQLSGYSLCAGREAAQRFMEFFGSVDRGDASQQVVERIRQVIENK